MRTKVLISAISMLLAVASSFAQEKSQVLSGEKVNMNVGGKEITLTVKSGKEYAQVGDTLPDFTVKMFDDRTIDTRDLRGKVVLINFWATWCGPCRKEFTRVPEEIVKRFEKEDFVFLPIARGETDKTIAIFRQETGYEFPMGIDTDAKIFGLFAQSLIPRNYIVDRDGKIVWAEIGYTPEGFEEMIENIAGLLRAE